MFNAFSAAANCFADNCHPALITSFAPDKTLFTLLAGVNIRAISALSSNDESAHTLLKAAWLSNPVSFTLVKLVIIDGLNVSVSFAPLAAVAFAIGLLSIILAVLITAFFAH
jgi:predicted permease